MSDDHETSRPDRTAAPGSPWLRELYELYAPVREEIRQRAVPEAEVNADIDAAISAVRAERHRDHSDGE